MTRKRIFSFIIAGIIIIWAFIFYNDNFSNKGILDNVTDRNGYMLNLVRENETVEFFIKPEWIPFDSQEEQELQIEVAEKNNTAIIFEGVLNREGNIHFNFDTAYELDYGSGRFLYNGIFNQDGTYTTKSSHYDYYLYNKDGEEFMVGQSGRGPESAFGFEVESENVDLIKDGFYVRYSGFYLYEYFKEN